MTQTKAALTKTNAKVPARTSVMRVPTPAGVRLRNETRAALCARVVQPALKVGAANDPLEREAETTAERIVSMPSPMLAPPDADPLSGGQGNGGQGAVQRASADDQPDLDTLEAAPSIPADHQDPEVPKEEDVDTTGLAAEDMKEIENGTPEDTAGDPPAEESPPPPEPEPAAQPDRSGEAAVVGAEGGAAPADVAQRVAQPGSGRPLPAQVRAFMEPRFGKDFSDVRLHDGAEDRAAARRIGARAFTHRQHIWMGPGETVENRRLMAHELTHVVQQTKPGPARAVKREVDPSEDEGEPKVRRGYVRNKAEKYARKVPGYRLISFILGKSPITGNRVERNATNLLGALLGMLGPLGDTIFERLKETRVIQEAFEWIDKRLTRLNITWTRIKSIISDIIDYLMDWPSDAISYAKKKFKPLVEDILTFVGEVKDKILEFIMRGALKLAGPLADKIWAVIQKAGSIISTILKDPLGFAKNLFSAVLKGFNQFGSRIFTHIKKGMLGWLFGAIQGLEITIPEKLDFKGLISIGLQVVGMTYAVFRAQLVKRLGANGERKVAFIEKSVEVVKILIKDGFVGIWQRVLQMIDNFKSTIIGGIKKFVIESLIMGGLGWLAKLSNPVGAIVGVVLAIYKIIKTFIERIDQILDVANSIFSSIGAIASGKIQQAANFIENTIAATIPVVISFLAALVPISGITNSIRAIIKKLQAPVKLAMGKMITFLVKKAKKLFSKIIGKLNKKRKLPSANFKVGKAQHRIYAEEKGKSVQVMIASSKGRPIEQVDAATKAEAKQLKGEDAKKIGASISGEVAEADDETGKAEKKVKLNSKNQNQNKNLKKVKEEIDEGAKEIEEASKAAATNDEVNEEDGCDGPLFRHSPERFAHEGKADTWSVLKKLMDKEPPTPSGAKISSIFERDHIPTKKTLRAIKKVIDRDQEKDGNAAPVTRTGTPPKDKEEKDPKPLGHLHTGSVKSNAVTHQSIILYAKLHTAKDAEDDAAKNIASSSKPLDQKIADFKTHLTAHVKQQADLVRKSYSAEELPEIIAKVEQGLVDITNKANENFKLGQAAVERPDAADIPKGPRDRAVFRNDKDKNAPNFADHEGKTGPHSAVSEKYSKRSFIESDHLIDNSYIEAVNTWKIRDVSSGISASLDRELEALPKKEREKAEARRDKLMATPIFSNPDMQNYTRSKGKTIAVFKGVHDQVDQPVMAAVEKDVRGEFNESRLSGVADYVKGVGNSDPVKLATGLRGHIKPIFGKRFGDHQKIIKGAYDQQKKHVIGLNPTNPDAAGREMDKIIGRVRQSISTLREDTFALFK